MFQRLLLDKAIQTLDASFTKMQGSKHYSSHKKEFPGLSKADYKAQAENETLRTKTNQDVEYKRKDGSKALYNRQSHVLTIWYPSNDTIATHFKPRFDKKKGKQNIKASDEYVRQDMRNNGLNPTF